MTFIMLIENGHTTLNGTDFLTTREKEILQLAADGYSNKEIADLLDLTRDTIDSHNRRLSVKLGAKNIKHAIAQGFRKKLIK